MNSRKTHLAGAEHVVHELEEALVLDLVVGEDEGDALAVGAGRAEEKLQVVHQVTDVVRARQCDLKRLVAGDERRQARERLFAGAADADEQRVTTWCADDARDLQQVRHRVLKVQRTTFVHTS